MFEIAVHIQLVHYFYEFVYLVQGTFLDFQHCSGIQRSIPYNEVKEPIRGKCKALNINCHSLRPKYQIRNSRKYLSKPNPCAHAFHCLWENCLSKREKSISCDFSFFISGYLMTEHAAIRKKDEKKFINEAVLIITKHSS